MRNVCSVQVKAFAAQGCNDPENEAAQKEAARFVQTLAEAYAKDEIMPDMLYKTRDAWFLEQYDVAYCKKKVVVNVRKRPSTLRETPSAKKQKEGTEEHEATSGCAELGDQGKDQGEDQGKDQGKHLGKGKRQGKKGTTSVGASSSSRPKQGSSGKYDVDLSRFLPRPPDFEMWL